MLHLFYGVAAFCATKVGDFRRQSLKERSTQKGCCSKIIKTNSLNFSAHSAFALEILLART